MFQMIQIIVFLSGFFICYFICYSFSLKNRDYCKTNGETDTHCYRNPFILFYLFIYGVYFLVIAAVDVGEFKWLHQDVHRNLPQVCYLFEFQYSLPQIYMYAHELHTLNSINFMRSLCMYLCIDDMMNALHCRPHEQFLSYKIMNLRRNDCNRVTIWILKLYQTNKTLSDNSDRLVFHNDSITFSLFLIFLKLFEFRFTCRYSN